MRYKHSRASTGYSSNDSRMGIGKLNPFILLFDLNCVLSFQKSQCMLPKDMKSFYLTRNGVEIEWSVRTDGSFQVKQGLENSKGLFFICS